MLASAADRYAPSLGGLLGRKLDPAGRIFDGHTILFIYNNQSSVLLNEKSM